MRYCHLRLNRYYQRGLGRSVDLDEQESVSVRHIPSPGATYLERHAILKVRIPRDRPSRGLLGAFIADKLDVFQGETYGFPDSDMRFRDLFCDASMECGLDLSFGAPQAEIRLCQQKAHRLGRRGVWPHKCYSCKKRLFGQSLKVGRKLSYRNSGQMRQSIRRGRLLGRLLDRIHCAGFPTPDCCVKLYTCQTGIIVEIK